MPPVEELASFPHVQGAGGPVMCKEMFRTGGEGGPLGVGRCSTSLYKDFLVNPKPTKSVNLESFVDGSVSSLLEHCLGWEKAECNKEEEEELSSPLLLLCATPSPSALHNIRMFCSQPGCDPNQTTSLGRSPLAVLLSSPHPALPSNQLLPTVASLLDAGALLDQRDTSTGNTPLLQLNHLLEKHQFQEAAEIAHLMLTHGSNTCDVNAVNRQGRSLLSYSVIHLDRAAELTRVLVNHGARVWPEDNRLNTVSDIDQDREQSAFTWFLRAVIHQRGLANTDISLDCLCHEMGRSPARMKAHVLRVMLSEGKFPRVLGPVFAQLKLTMAPFWTEPQHLRYLAWNSVRRSLGPKRLGPGSQQLGLPTPLTNYITLGSSTARRSFK